MDEDPENPPPPPPKHNQTKGDDAGNRDEHKLEGVLLVNTWNGFNEISRKAIL